MCVVDLRGVDLWFANGPQVLHDVSLRVGAGEHWALLGPNGAGKSSLLSVAGAQRFPSRGTVDLLGRRLGSVDVRELRAQLGVVDQRLRLPRELSVADYVATGFTQTVQSIRTATPDQEARVGELVDQMDLGGVARRSIALCSQGEQARARLARALVAEPRLLLLDEPAAGLDLPGRADLLDAMARATVRNDHASITVAHHLEELPSTTTHVALLRGGRLVAVGDTGLLGDEEALSRCFGRRVRTVAIDGRWFAVAG